MATYLHVLYAGRGDAFILEEEDAHRFYLIDGGPQAPYYEYLKASVKLVSETVRPGQPIQPDGVFISHWHEDHYGGLLRLFEDFLAPEPTNEPTEEHPLVFNGPLFAPASTDRDAKKVLKALTERGFKAEPGSPPDGFAFGGAEQILAYRRTNAMAEVDWSVDGSAENRNSLLLAHESRMVFTGDSVGSLIEPFLHGFGEKPAFRLFKVPHHGSLRNSQLLSDAAKVNYVARADYGLHVLLSWRAGNPFGFPYPLSDVPLLLNAVNAMLTEVIAGIYPGDSTAEKNLTKQIADRITEFERGKTSWTPQLGQDDIDTPRIWNSLEERIKSNPGQLFYDEIEVREEKRVSAPPERFGFPQPAPVQVSRVQHINKIPFPWTAALLHDGNLEDFYRKRIAINQLMAFYSSFTAEAYVISANGQHGHPAEVTIAAIAAVARQRQQRTHLFVTDAQSVDLAELGALLNDWNQNLTIHYLRAQSAKLDPALADAAMDVENATSDLVAGGVDFQQLHQFFENGPDPLPDVMPLYQITTGQGSSLSLAGGTPSVVPGPVQCEVRDWRSNPRIRFGDLEIVDRTSRRSAFFAVLPTSTGRFVLGLYPFSVLSVAPNLYVTATADGEGSFVTTDPNDARIAQFSFEPVAPQTGSLAAFETSADGASPLPFRTFCADAGLPAAGTVTAQAALAAMAGPEAMTLVLQKVGGLAIDKRLLAWPVDRDASQVAYDKRPLLAVSSADLRLKPPAGTVVNVAGAPLLVTGAEVTLTWTEALTVAWHVETEQGIELKHGGTVPGASYSRSVSVPEYLVAVGIAEAEAGSLPIGKVLVVMLGSPGRAEQVMTNLPGALLLAEAPLWAIDPSSRVEIAAGPLGRIEVKSARLGLRPPQGAALSLSVEGLSFALSDLVLNVEDARLVGEQVRLSGTATLANSVKLDAAIDLTKESAGLVLKLPKQASLADLSAVLPGAPDLGALSAPAGSLLSAMTLSEPGVYLEQASAGSNNYTIASAFVTAAFDGWKSLLPPSITPPAKTSVFLEVIRPLSDSRRVGLTALFELSAGGKPLAVTLSATPLPYPGEYAWAFEVASDLSAPANLAEVLGALSLNERLASAIAATPVLGSVLGNAWLDQASFTLEAGAFSEFSLGLLCDRVTLVPDLLELQGVRLDVGYVSQGWSARASASLDLALAGASFDVSASLPTPGAPGFVAFANPQELTIAGFLEAVKLPVPPADLPVIGALTRLAIREAEVALAYPPAPGGERRIAVTGGRVVTVMEELQVGPLHLSAIVLEVSYTTAAGADESDPQGTGFSLQARLGRDGAVLAALEYDKAGKTLSGSLNAEAAATVGDLLAAILPAGVVLDALRSVVGALALKEASVVLACASEPRLTRFTVELASGASLDVAALAVTGLALASERITPAGEDFKTTLKGAVALNLDALTPAQSGLAGLRYLLDRKSGAPPLRLLASAEIAPGASIADKARFEAHDTAEMTLVSAVHVQGLHVAYQPVANPRLVIDIDQAWISIPTSSGVYTPRFEGQIVLGKVPKPGAPGQMVDGATASLAKIVGADSHDGGGFLGIPRLKLSELTLKMVWAFDLQRTVRLAGKVVIGRLTLAAAVLFEDETAKVITISLAGGVSLADLFSSCLGLSDWGAASLPEISLSKGQLTYRAAGGSEPRRFEAGCALRLLGRDFLVTGSLTDGVGAQITGTLAEPVDALVLKLTGAKGQGGPSLSLTSTTGGGSPDQRKLAFAFGLDVFGQIFKDGSLSYTPASGSDPATYGGSIRYTGELPLLGAVDWALSATWDEDRGFRIHDWPLDTNILRAAGRALDLARLFEDLSGKVGSCPSVKLDALWHGAFKLGLTPSLASGGKLAFRARVSYEMSLKNPFTGDWHSIFVAAVESDPVEVDIPTSFRGFLETLADVVVQLGPKMVTAMVRDPATMGKIIVVIGARNLSEQALNALTCRKPPSTPKPAPPGNQNPGWPPSPPLPPIPPPLPPLPPWNDDDDDDDGGGSGGVTVDPRLTLAKARALLEKGRAETSLAVATADLAHAAALATSIAGELSEAGQVASEAKAALVSRYKVTGFSLRDDGGSSVTASWNLPPAPPDFVRVIWSVVSPGGQVLSVPTDQTSLLFENVEVTPGTSVTAKIRANVVVSTAAAFVNVQAVSTAVMLVIAPAITPWTGTYNTEMDLDFGGYSLSPLVIAADGTLTVAGERVVYTWDGVRNELSWDWHQIGATRVRARINFFGSGAGRGFNGTSGREVLPGPEVHDVFYEGRLRS